MEVDFPNKLRELETTMVSMPQAECPVTHTFHNGVYMRQVTLKAGTFAIGHHQRFEHLNIMVTGRVTMVNDDGSRYELIAPQTWIAPPGRKVGYIHEDVTWINVYKTDITDSGIAEEVFLDKSQSMPVPEQLFIDNTDNVSDYKLMLEEYGFDEATARSQSEDLSDQIPFPNGCYKCAVADSPIEGKGLFATNALLAGEFIAPARLNGFRTPAGRYINHSKTPNAEMVAINGDVHVRALVDIEGCRGGGRGSEITTDYRNNLELIRSISCHQ